MPEKILWHHKSWGCGASGLEMRTGYMFLEGKIHYRESKGE